MKKLRTPEVDVEHDTATAVRRRSWRRRLRVRAERAPQSDVTNGHRRTGGRSLDASGLFTECRLALLRVDRDRLPPENRDAVRRTAGRPARPPYRVRAAAGVYFAAPEGAGRLTPA